MKKIYHSPLAHVVNVPDADILAGSIEVRDEDVGARFDFDTETW